MYVNLGKKQGLAAGNYLRIFRSYLSQDDDSVLKGADRYPTEMMGMPEGHKLTLKEKESVPRAVLGELLILNADEESATGIITYSVADIFAGDGVEIE